MRNRAFLLVLVVVVVGATIFAGPALAGKPGQGAVREAVLTAADDPDGSGIARFTFYPNKNKICYRIEVSNIDPATAAHLHEDSASEPDPVKLNLKPPRDGSSRECIRNLGERFIRHISKNLSNFYVDVHNPDVAVRGQLSE